MSLISRGRRIVLLSLALIMTAASVTMAAGSGRLELLLKYRNVQFDLYKVGTYEVTGSERRAELTEAFREAGVDLSKLWSDGSAAEFHREAEIFEAFIKREKPQPLVSAITMEDYSGSDTSVKGTATIESLEDGIYILIKSGGDSSITVDPILVTMPYLDVESQEWSYFLKMYPKCEYKPDTPGGKDNGGGGSSGGRTQRTTQNIGDSDVPLAGLEILDEPVPLAGIPKLGDLGAGVYLLMALASGAVGGIALRKGRKYRENEQ